MFFMKKFLFTLLILTIGVPVYAKNINFIHVTDVHFTQANAHYLKEFTNEILRQLINRIEVYEDKKVEIEFNF